MEPQLDEERATKSHSKAPLALGVSFGVVVVLSAIVILTGVSYVVYIKRRKGKMGGFIQLKKIDAEVET